jgi:outer membrane protein OmpA-like peptidoglycan-associated protein
MKLQRNLLGIYVLLLSVCVYAQQDVLTTANKNYTNMSYSQAIKLYNALIRGGYGSSELFENLGNSYYYQSNYALANDSYDSLFKRTEDVSKSTYYRYVNVLRSQNKQAAADLWLNKLKNKFPESFQRSSNSSDILTLTPNTLAVESIGFTNLGINSMYSDYKASYLGDSSIVFTSSRDTRKFTSLKSPWTSESYSNLYQSNLSSDKDGFVVTKLKGSVNSSNNESSAIFSKDGKTMYFTRNNMLNGKVKTDSLNNVLLKIYQATFDGKRWGSVKELPFNSNDYSCAHPALSPNEDYLYFSSDMPGTIGESDLYRVSILEGDTLGTPENLGPQINTLGRDTFPFITSDNLLIFSSDYRNGLGGLDLYYLDLKDNDTSIYTFSAPINSSFDDFGLIYKVSEGTGFMSSNRQETNTGSDDIYEFTGLRFPRLENVTLKVQSDKETTLIGVTEVVVLDENKKVIGKTTLQADGSIRLAGFDVSKTYYLELKNENYQTYAQRISIAEARNKISLIAKQPIQKEIDLRDVLKLNNIYFGFDQWTITKEASLELAKVVTILNQYPEIRIDIIGHTDFRGPAVYNERLSAQRAASVRQWLVDRGISAGRMTTFGYGEKKPINDCTKNKCTKGQHDQNRRTEFLIAE